MNQVVWKSDFFQAPKRGLGKVFLQQATNLSVSFAINFFHVKLPIVYLSYDAYFQTTI